MRTNPIITLTTDFGNSDGFVGIMKGVIFTINPKTTIVDITHQVPRHNINAGAFLLNTSYHYFPQGTIHLVVVDPGVGSLRRPIIAQTKNYMFVAPDNEILAYVFHNEPEVKVYHAQNPDYFLKQVGNTFHGRDIFSPVAAHLSTGVAVEAFGNQISDYRKGEIPGLTISDDHIIGTIVYCDVFGNLITNIPSTHVQNKTLTIYAGKYKIDSLSSSYIEGSKSSPIAIISSSGFLEIAINQKSAKDMLNLYEGDRVEVVIS